jgi:hypothetical protein
MPAEPRGANRSGADDSAAQASIRGSQARSAYGQNGRCFPDTEEVTGSIASTAPRVARGLSRGSRHGRQGGIACSTGRWRRPNSASASAFVDRRITARRRSATTARVIPACQCVEPVHVLVGLRDVAGQDRQFLITCTGSSRSAACRWARAAVVMPEGGLRISLRSGPSSLPVAHARTLGRWTLSFALMTATLNVMLAICC